MSLPKDRRSEDDSSRRSGTTSTVTFSGAPSNESPVTTVQEISCIERNWLARRSLAVIDVATSLQPRRVMDRPSRCLMPSFKFGPPYGHDSLSQIGSSILQSVDVQQ